jgi:hypothetical protein
MLPRFQTLLKWVGRLCGVISVVEEFMVDVAKVSDLC